MQPLVIPAQGLNEKQLQAIADLESRVVASDGGRLKLEWRSLQNRSVDEVRDVLCWSDDRRTLLGFAGLYAFGYGTVEIAGMVDPQYRRLGIGRALLRVALAECKRREQPAALLVVPRGRSGHGFAAAIGGRLEHSEHAMVLSARPSPGTARAGVVIQQTVQADVGQLAEIVREAFGHTMLDDADVAAQPPGHRRLTVMLDGEIAGGLRTVIDDDTGRIYGFAIRRELRGQGIGGEVLRRVCSELFDEGMSSVSLEVLTDNDHALGLYESVGFRRLITEDYFELAV